MASSQQWPDSQGRVRPRREEVRDALLRAAFEEFAERGYQAASVESIAARAGFTKGAVYGNYDGKFGLLLELLGPDSMNRASFQEGLGGEPGDPDASLRHIAEEIHRVSQDYLPSLMVAEARGHAARSPELSSRFAEVRTSVVDRLSVGLGEELARVGLTTVVPVREVLFALLAVVGGVSLEQVGVPEPVVSVETVERVVRALIVPVS